MISIIHEMKSVCCCRGRFGQVHKCAELSSGLTLAAKIIKVRGMKERVSTKHA